MVSGSQNKKGGKASKKKQKLVFAKDKNQIIVMAVVMAIFVLTSLFNLANYIKSQMPQANQPSATQQINDDINSEKALNPEDPSTPANPINKKTPPPVQPANSGASPVIPILIFVLIACAIGGGAYLINQNGGFSKIAEGRVKKDSAQKNIMNIIKNKNQLIIAVAVVLAFILALILLAINLYNESHPAFSKAESDIAKQQQQNLESLNGAAQPSNNQVAQDTNDIYSQTMDMQQNPVAPDGNTVSAPEQNSGDDVEILTKNSGVLKNKGKMITIAVSDSGRSNPFLPAAENVVPKSTLSYLTAPPEALQTKNDASKIMTTKISGILYDKYNPSAIINIEGTDYLVRREDVVNHYRVLSINPTQVLVQLGKNVYRAGVGEILSDAGLNHNVIANLDKKFGGNEIPIRVKKKHH